MPDLTPIYILYICNSITGSYILERNFILLCHFCALIARLERLKMAVGEGSGTTVQLEETTESVKLLINESWCALAGDKGIQKGFLP